MLTGPKWRSSPGSLDVLTYTGYSSSSLSITTQVPQVKVPLLLIIIRPQSRSGGAVWWDRANEVLSLLHYVSAVLV